MVETISVEKALTETLTFIDTRTPKEFALDHLPKAVNLPVFSNEERAVVGTLYKQVSQQKAIDQGIEYFSQKLPDFIKRINQYKDQKLIIYCWRGGMRSRAIVALLESLGYDVVQLEGGYKSYRKYVLTRLQNYQLKPQLIILWGLTCTGKTQLLSKFANSLDLEGLAQHRGSLYGAIGLKPNSQKRFENLLLRRLEQLNGEKYLIVEGESRKIGDVQIPDFLWKAMKKGINALVSRDIHLRVKTALEEYFKSEEDFQKIREVTERLWKVISKKKKEEVLALLGEKEYEKAVKILLINYYDPLYSYSLKKISYALEINNDDVEKAVEELKKKIKKAL